MDNILIIVLSLLFSSLFSGIEIAYVSSNKLKLEVLRGTRNFALQFFLPQKRESLFFTTVLIGNNIALVVFSLFLAESTFRVINQFFHVNQGVLSFLVETVFCTLIIIVFGEFLPKLLFRLSPNKMLIFFSPLLYSIFILLFPFIIVVNFFADLIMKAVLKEEKNAITPSSLKMDLVNFLDEAEKETEESVADNINIIRNAIRFDEVRVRDCMTPRNEIISVNVKAPKEKIKEHFEKTGFSRLPVHESEWHNIVGYIHYFDFFQYPQKSISELIRKVPFVSEAMSANKLLQKFMGQKNNMAFVSDEYGETAGLVTLEDVIEEITGEIFDEHDKTFKLYEHQIDEKTLRISARHETEYIAKKYNFPIEESDEYNTISGFIITKLGRIPEANETITFERIQVEILEIDSGKINTVLLKNLAEIDEN